MQLFSPALLPTLLISDGYIHRRPDLRTGPLDQAEMMFDKADIPQYSTFQTL